MLKQKKKCFFMPRGQFEFFLDFERSQQYYNGRTRKNARKFDRFIFIYLYFDGARFIV